MATRKATSEKSQRMRDPRGPSGRRDGKQFFNATNQAAKAVDVAESIPEAVDTVRSNVAKARRRGSVSRDSRTNLGRGLPSTIVSE